MSLEIILPHLLNPLIDDQLFPDVAPAGIVPPYAVWQQVGGPAGAFVEGGRADLRVSRIQIAVWATTRREASGLMRKLEECLIAAPTFADPLGELVSDFDPDTDLRGARQDFYIGWR